MDAEVLTAYLDAAATLHAMPLTAEQRARVLLQMERFAAIADVILTLPLLPADEPILGPLP